MKVIKGLSAILLLTGILSSLYALGANWLTLTEEQMITDTTPAPPDSYSNIGLSVDVSQDNQTLVALFPGIPSFAHLKVYSKDPVTDQWIVSATLNPSLSFGTVDSECVISGDGNVIALASNGFSGHVLIFERQQDNSWIETQVITKPAGVQMDIFPNSIDLSFHGRTLVIGGQNISTSPSAVFIFEKSLGASLYANVQRIDSHIPHPTGSDFGNAVALNDDGNTLAVGTPGLFTGSFIGTVSLYKFEVPGGWTFKKDLQASDGMGLDRFGHSLDFSPGSGNHLLVGAPATNLLLSSGAGKAHLYNVANPSFPEVETFSPSDNQLGQGFGFSVSFGRDAKTVVIGSPTWDNPPKDGNTDGALYVFKEVAGIWQESAKAMPDLATALPNEYIVHFGRSVAAASSEIHIGAPKLDLSETEIDRGALFTYDTGSLSSNTESVSVSTGGIQPFSFCYDPALLAGKPYVVLGAAGTYPGLNIEDFNIPLSIDSYFLTTLMSPPASGTLDASGQLNFSNLIPAGLSPSLVGLKLYHAVVVFDITGLGIEFVSNEVPLELTP